MSEQAANEWAAFCSNFARFAKRIDGVKSVNVNSAPVRDEAKQIAQFYFRRAVPRLVPLNLGKQVDVLTQAFQSLLHLSDGRNALSSYKKQVKRIRKAIPGITGQIELLIGEAKPSGDEASKDEKKIIGTLEKLVPSAALSYQQALADLLDGKRVSFRGPALELREALREVLDHIAPDEAVEKSDGYKREDKRTGPTMRQKVRFILKTRGQSKSSSATPENATEAIDELIGNLARSVYERTNVATHVAMERPQVVRLKRYVDAVLYDILEL